MIRRKLIAGNWKMNKTAADGVALTKDIADAIGREGTVDVVLCPPFISLAAVSRVIKDSHLKLGAQNVYPAEQGAYTGEISPLQ